MYIPLPDTVRGSRGQCSRSSAQFPGQCPEGSSVEETYRRSQRLKEGEEGRGGERRGGRGGERREGR